MAADAARATGPLDDRAQVRLFTLADHVSDEVSGKLYISGAGLEWTGLPVRPDPSGSGCLLSCYLVIRLAFPKAIARASHTVEVRAVRGDGSPAGPDALVLAELQFDLDRTPPNLTEVSGTMPILITDYPSTATTDEAIFFELVVDEVLLSRLPVELLLVEGEEFARET